MKSKEIKYIGFYDIQGNGNRNRVSNLAAINKMNYIVDSLVDIGFSVHIISPSWINDLNRKFEYQRKTKVKLKDKVYLSFFPSIVTNFKLLRYIKIVYTLTYFFFYLLKNVHKDEKVLVYHVPWLSLPLRLAKYIKKFIIILEVEEVYGDISSINPFFDIMENKLIESADYFLFSTELLRDRIGNIKPNLIIYGVYNKVEKKYFPPNDGKIHLLYAGILDFKKGGAINAIESAKHLPSNYILHIIGFGETVELEKRIKQVNILSGCKVIYDGIKTGEDFIKYCQMCHIGLSTQNMEGKYLESSFPSKILTYLSFGLKVVSCNVACVSKSEISPCVKFYSNNNPSEIAKAIIEVNLDSNYIDLVDELDDKFKIGLRKFFT